MIADNNRLLDELESIASSKPLSFRPTNHRALTLKSTSDYLAAGDSWLLEPDDRGLASVTVTPIEKNIRTSLKSLAARFIKRSVDLVGAALGLILTLPFWILVPLLIKLNSKGPVFYTQTRVGRNRREVRRRLIPQDGAGNSRKRERRRENTYGQTFRILKFRTMIDRAERSTGPVWATKDDIRITSIGSVLRKLRLDEIPQFWNVLAGDMSLVGPRPERPNFVRELSHEIDDYGLRLEAKPGITGLAQVKGSYDTSPATVARKLKMDVEYIEKWSLWLDIKILFKTVWVVLSGKGAH